MRLGRLPADPAALARAPSLAAHRFAALAPPAAIDRGAVPFAPGLYENDTLPDCTAAGLANAAGMVAALNGFSLAIDPARVPAFYAGCVGCAPTDAAMAATDGAVMLDVLTRQAVEGFDVGPQLLAGLFGTLPLRRTAMANAIATLGHLYLGLTLRERDMELPAVWEVVAGVDDGAIVGGHCVVLWDYAGLADADTVRVATWGGWQPATWAWLAARTDEAHALFWRQLGAAAGQDIGVDAGMLAADLAALTGTPLEGAPL